MLKRFLLDLQKFAEGGGDGGDGGSTSTVGEVKKEETSGEVEIPAFIPEKAKNLYQKAMAKTKGSTTDATTNAEGNTQTTNETSTTEKLSYADLIKSDEYKEEHQAYMDKTIGDRLKKYKGVEETNGKYKAILDTVAQKYGVNPDDENFLDTLSQKVEADDSYYEQYALEHDVSTEEARNIVTMERKARMYDAQKEEAEKQERMRERIMTLRKNAEATKSRFPNFDLDSAMQNEQFRRLCAATNGDTTAAYMACNWNEIIPNTVQMASKQIQEQMSQSIASNKSRPIENGISSQAPSVVQQNFKGMSLKELKEYKDKYLFKK